MSFCTLVFPKFYVVPLRFLKFYFLPWRFWNFLLYPLVFEILSDALHILKFFTMPSLFRFYVCSIFFLCPFFSFFSLLLLSLFHFSCESWQKRWFVFLFFLLTLSVSFPSPSPSLWIFYFSSFLLSSSLCLLIFWFSLLYASRVLFPRFVAVHGRPSDVYVCGRRGWAAESPSISDISVQSVVGKFRDRICSRPVVYRPCAFCGCLSTKAWPYLGHHLAVSRPSLSRCSAISRSSLWRVS